VKSPSKIERSLDRSSLSSDKPQALLNKSGQRDYKDITVSEVDMEEGSQVRDSVDESSRGGMVKKTLVRNISMKSKCSSSRNTDRSKDDP
jgi:hypothetical protein